MAAQQLLQLQEAFPEHTDAQIRAALLECGDLGLAAEMLLLQAASAAHTHKQARPETPSQPSRPSTSKPSWAALRNTPGPQEQAAAPRPQQSSSSAPPSPVYIRNRGKLQQAAPTFSFETFPDLFQCSQQVQGSIAAGLPGVRHTPGSAVAPARLPEGYSNSSNSSSKAGLNQPDRTYNKAGRGAAPAAIRPPRRCHSASSFADAAAKHNQPEVQQQQRQWQQQQAWQQREQHQEQQDMQQLVLQLAQLHPWCEPELLEEVLLSVDRDGTAAAAALMELAPAGAQQETSSSKPFTAAAAAAVTAGSSCTAAGAAAGTVARTAAGAAAAAAVPSGSGQGSSSAVQYAGDHGCVDPQQDEGWQGSGQADVYYTMRREALRLTRKWQKVLRRSAAAAAAGEHSTAKQLSAEARLLKEAVDAAHAAAAVKIEVANNKYSSAGLWELDLHGLHISEAIDALQQRLDLLHSLVHDLMQGPMPAASTAAAAAASPAGPLDHSNSSGAAAAPRPSQPTGSSRQQVLSQLLLSDDQPVQLQQAAARQELRVIVGRGNNSSAGEASLPRAIERWLADEQYKYVFRSGAVDVKLKRCHQGAIA